MLYIQELGQNFEMAQLKMKGQGQTHTSMAARIATDPMFSLLKASALFWSLALTKRIVSILCVRVCGLLYCLRRMSRWKAAKVMVARKRTGSVIAYGIHIFARRLLALPRSIGRQVRAISETTNIKKGEWRIAKVGDARIGKALAEGFLTVV